MEDKLLHNSSEALHLLVTSTFSLTNFKLLIILQMLPLSFFILLRIFIYLYLSFLSCFILFFIFFILFFIFLYLSLLSFCPDYSFALVPHRLGAWCVNKCILKLIN